MDDIEELWEKLLSRDQDLIENAFMSLTRTEQNQVFNHLKTMSTESGWHEEQKISADAAIEVITRIMQ